MKSKKIICIFLLLLLMNIFISCFIPNNAYALNGEEGNNTTPQTRLEHDQQNEQDTEDNENAAGEAEIDDKYKGQNAFERMIATLFTSLAEGIFEILQIKDPLTLIFDYEPFLNIGEAHVSRDNLYLGIYDQSEMSVITAMYRAFEAYLPLWLFVAIVLTGLLMVFAGFGGDPRLTAKQYISGILLTCVLLFFGPNLIDFVFEALYAGVDIVKNLIEQTALERSGKVPDSLIDMLFTGFMSKEDDIGIIMAGVTNLMYTIIIFMVFLGAGVMNWQYIVRKITLAVLIFMFPIVAGMAVIPNTRGALKMWFSEFFANVFLVLAHAVVYGFLIMISMSPEQSFSPLEIIIYIIGLNGTVGIVRGMFGAHQGRGGALGGLGNVLGLTSLMGVGRMALGMKGGIGSVLTEKTAREAVAQGTSAAGQAGSTVSTFKDIDKIAGTGNDLTPSQVDLMAAQMTGNETDEQKMELAGAQKNISIDNQVETATEPYKPKKFSSKIAKVGGVATKIGGVATLGSAGALISGMVTGNATGGIAPGVFVGNKLANGTINTSKNIVKAIRNPNSMGIYNAGQLFDSKSAREIGRRIAGKPGAAVGWTASKVTSALGFKNPIGVRVGSIDTRNQETRFAERIRTDINSQYESAQQSYMKSQQEMQLAQYSLQQIEEKYSVKSKKNNRIYQRERQEAFDHLEDLKNQFHESQVCLKEAEIRKQHEHDYVGIQMKMDKIRRAGTNSDGGIS